MKKIRVLALVLVFAFAALGGAYAAWSDSIFINETVTTGSVDIQWQNAGTSDGLGTDGYYKKVFSWRFPFYKYVWIDGTDGEPDVMAEGYNNDEELNVASKTVDIGDENENLEAEMSTFCGGETETYVKGDGDMLNITLENGYPGYTAYVTADIANIGSVPVRCDFRLGEGDYPEWMRVKIVDADTDVVYWDSASGQVNATPTIECDDSITVEIHEEILDGAPQLDEATFSIKVIGIQWNAHDFEAAV